MTEQPNNTNNLKSGPGADLNQTVQPNSRRSFLTKASVGIVIASMPAKSVWASGGGVAQSIVASGHGSDFADGDPIGVLSPGYWKNHYEQYHALVFSTVFGGPAFEKNGSPTQPAGLTFGQILTEKGDKFKGEGNVNFFMVAMYLNAINHGIVPELNYPILGLGKPFADGAAFASYLYQKALLDAGTLGNELSWIIDNYHA